MLESHWTMGEGKQTGLVVVSIIAATGVAVAILHHQLNRRMDRPKSQVELLAERLDLGPVEDRRAAVKRLADLGPDALPALPQLIRALSDQDSFVQIRAAEMLGRFGPGVLEAVVPLKAAMDKSESQHFRVVAANSLWCITRDPELVVSTFIQAVEALDHYEMRGGMIRDDPGLAREILAGVLAMNLLGELGPQAERAVPCLVKVIEDHSRPYRRGAAIALLKIDPEVAKTVGAEEIAEEPRGNVPLQSR